MAKCSVIIGVTTSELSAVAVFATPLFLAWLYGVYKCVRVARRTTTHTLCVLSLVFWMFGFFLLPVSGLVATLEDGFGRYLMAGGLLAILGVICLIVSVVLGFVGLVDVGRRTDDLNQGGAQAKTGHLERRGHVPGLSAVISGIA